MVRGSRRVSIGLKPQRRWRIGVLPLLLVPSGALAGAGDLGVDFGDEGLVTTDFGGAFDQVSGLDVRADGKIVAAGRGGPQNRLCVAVYDRPGTPDCGFNGNGRLIVDETGGVGDVMWVAGEKLLLGGTWFGSPFGFMVARLEPGGNFDGSFGSGGVRSVPMGSQPTVRAVRMQSDGRILLAGYSFFSGNWSWALARFTAAGAVDTTFDGDGIVTTDFSPSGVLHDWLFDVAIQPAEGRIVAGGKSQESAGLDRFTLARYKTDGSLDPSFGTGGKLVIPPGQISTRGIIYDVEVLPDGRILACGAADADAVVMRFHGHGEIDETFGTDGCTRVSFSPSNDIFEAMTVDAKGRIAVAGSAFLNGQWRQVLARLRSDGRLDPVFGAAGKKVTDYGTAREEAHRLALTPDDWILVGGSTGTANVDTNFSLTWFSNASTGSPQSFAVIGLDGEASTSDGAVWTLNTSGSSVAVDRSGFSASERRGVLEFDVRELPPEAKVLSARLSLDISAISFFPDVSYPFIEVYGYDGDGALEASDATSTVNPIGASAPIEAQGPLTIDLTGMGFIESVRDRASTHLGLVLRAGRADHLAALFTTEGAVLDDQRPKLTIGYVVNPILDPADFDEDGDVDGEDAALFVDCAAGPQITLDTDCKVVDLDGDQDGDQVDFAMLQRRLTTGAGQ